MSHFLVILMFGNNAMSNPLSNSFLSARKIFSGTNLVKINDVLYKC